MTKRGRGFKKIVLTPGPTREEAVGEGSRGRNEHREPRTERKSRERSYRRGSEKRASENEDGNEDEAPVTQRQKRRHRVASKLEVLGSIANHLQVAADGGRGLALSPGCVLKTLHALHGDGLCERTKMQVKKVKRKKDEECVDDGSGYVWATEMQDSYALAFKKSWCFSTGEKWQLVNGGNEKKE